LKIYLYPSGLRVKDLFSPLEINLLFRGRGENVEARVCFCEGGGRDELGGRTYMFCELRGWECAPGYATRGSDAEFMQCHRPLHLNCPALS